MHGDERAKLGEDGGKRKEVLTSVITQSKQTTVFWHVSVSVFDPTDITPLAVGNGLGKIQSRFPRQMILRCRLSLKTASQVSNEGSNHSSCRTPKQSGLRQLSLIA
jgi:hypothetical protein